MKTQNELQTLLNKRLNDVIYEAQAEFDHLDLQTILNALADARTDAPHVAQEAIQDCHQDDEPEPLNFDDALGRKCDANERYRAQMIDAGCGHLLGD
jgi:hypothetical protein